VVVVRNEETRNCRSSTCLNFYDNLSSTPNGHNSSALFEGMSTNGAPSFHKSSGSSSEIETHQALNDVRISSDSDRSANTSSPIHSNGVNGRTSSDSESDPVAQLQQELDRTKEEKEALAGQYRNLLAKLTTMRTTLGNKLQQDAVRTFGSFRGFSYHVADILSLWVGRTGPTGATSATADCSER
jgi:hypothetical protein